MPLTMPSTAWSSAASSKTMFAALPPSSSVSALSVPAVALWISFPTPVEPVKATLSTSGLERRCDLPGEHQQREVPQNDLRRDAQRLRDAARKRVLELVRPARVVPEVVRDERDVDVARLLDRLARVHRLEDRELAGALLEDPCDPEQVLGALLAGEVAPARLLRPPRGSDRAIHVGGRGLRDLGDDLLGGRVDALEPTAVAGVRFVAVDEQAVAGLDADDVPRLGCR